MQTAFKTHGKTKGRVCHWKLMTIVLRVWLELQELPVQSDRVELLILALYATERMVFLLRGRVTPPPKYQLL